MPDLAIKADHISKIFRIYDKPTDRLRESFSLSRKKHYTDFQALHDVSFEVKKGEFLGIVGKNGAGKSTLLKILSRELTPSSGSVAINGKVSLLQLGVGFDAELTGIENARFASKLLGYNDDEVEAMMEEIIAFADIGEFIYHPVKTYSSGMYSRLSFAVGVNIDPDILIADEVLAVGDMRFSQKCLRKMREFKEKGKTIILVTHDTGSVNVFCDTAMWLMNGKIFQIGEAKSVARDFVNYMLYDKLPEEYDLVANVEDISLNQNIGNKDDKNSDVCENIEWQDLSKFPSIGDGRAEIQKMAFLLRDTMERVHFVRGNEYAVIVLNILIKGDIQRPQVGIRVNNQKGLVVVHTNNDNCGKTIPSLNHGNMITVKFTFKLPSISNGNYTLSIGLQDNAVHQDNIIMPQLLEDVYEFIVNRQDEKSTQCGYVLIEEQEVDISIS